jgi:heme/copper-type cytochrome/quinol oxidase subunit 3
VGVTLRAYLELRRTLWVCTLVSLVFAAMFIFGIRLRLATPDWPKAFQFGSLLMAVAMTTFGLAASVTAELGARAAADAEVEPSVRWLAIAISCWLVFLFLEIVEWVRLIFLINFGFDTPFGRAHLTLSGFHWFAVLAGVGWLTWAIAHVRTRNLLPAALFSHVLNFWWLAILFIMYFTNASLAGF